MVGFGRIEREQPTKGVTGNGTLSDRNVPKQFDEFSKYGAERNLTFKIPARKFCSRSGKNGKPLIDVRCGRLRKPFWHRNQPCSFFIALARQSASITARECLTAYMACTSAKPEVRIMPLSSANELSSIKPTLPNKPRGLHTRRKRRLITRRTNNCRSTRPGDGQRGSLVIRVN